MRAIVSDEVFIDAVQKYGRYGAAKQLGQAYQVINTRANRMVRIGKLIETYVSPLKVKPEPVKRSANALYVSNSTEVRRHLIIPDGQHKPGNDITHVEWAAQAIVDYTPDVIVVIGDWWDMPSLSTHDAPGSREAEGRRVKPDIDAGNKAWERLVAPMNAVRAKKGNKWNPECHFLFGNHEDRLTRAIFRDPKWEGLLSLDAFKTPGFMRHNFLDIVEIDGIKYCHYFPNPFSGRPIGGTIPNRLNHVGSSFVQGHQQGFQYGVKQYPDHVKHGLVCGRFYMQNEHYRAQDVQRSEWNGICVLNGVLDGDYDLMPLRMDYLQKRYG